MKNKRLILIIIFTVFLIGCKQISQLDEGDLLEGAIHSSILKHNGDKIVPNINTQNYFACESHTILKQEDISDMITVYAIVLYQEYELNGNELSLIRGSHIPTALSFTMEKDNYKLEEYWIPDEGDNYEPEIKEKFPAEIYADAINIQKYVKEQADSCYQQAADYFNILK